MDNIVSAKLDSRYASTLGVWQYDYGQVLRITGPELPPAVEVQFSLDEKSGETLSRVGTTVDGVTEVKIPDELLTHSATSNYRIYAYIYLTDETSGNTKYEITIPVRVRSKPTSPAEDPETDPDLFRETVVAVNASAERAENAASSAMESAASADETLAEIKRVADGISGKIENANTMKSELSDMINNAGIEKKELESSIGKAGEAKMALDSSIGSAGEKQLALDTTVEHANTVDASLKEHIDSAEQIQANVEQIANNKEDIGSLQEDLSNKITKFYASNQGETHLADSDNGKIMDMMLYGRSEQKQYKGINLLPPNIKYSEFIEVSIPKETKVFAIADGTKFSGGNFLFFNADKTKREWFGLDKDTTISTRTLTIDAKYVQNLLDPGLDVSKICLGIGSEPIYEPYVGGKPSPSPDYPQEIKSVGDSGSVAVKVMGKNLIPTNCGQNITALRYDAQYNRWVFDALKSVGMVNLRIIDPMTAHYFLSAGTYTITLVSFENVQNVAISAVNADWKTLASVVPGRPSKTFSVDANTIVGCYFVPKDVNATGYLQVQLELGTTATSYEPYTEQSVQLPYTLNAIPVASGGNVTIDGQQYIADRVVEKDGVFGIERNTATDVPVLTKELRETPDMKGRFIQDGALKKTFTPLYESLVNIGYSRKWGVAGSVIDKWIFGVNKVNLYISPPKDLNYTSEDTFNALKDLNIKVYGALLVPFFEPLPGDIQAKLRTLVTNYPVTNISVTSDQLDGYAVFNYPISMANGWNYVKQQLNDNRDYIYDMDIQSAEAYVNSEYAVALTELEV